MASQIWVTNGRCMGASALHMRREKTNPLEDEQAAMGRMEAAMPAGTISRCRSVGGAGPKTGNESRAIPASVSLAEGATRGAVVSRRARRYAGLSGAAAIST